MVADDAVKSAFSFECPACGEYTTWPTTVFSLYDGRRLDCERCDTELRVSITLAEFMGRECSNAAHDGLHALANGFDPPVDVLGHEVYLLKVTMDAMENELKELSTLQNRAKDMETRILELKRKCEDINSQLFELTNGRES